jgi:hypothetical protein
MKQLLVAATLAGLMSTSVSAADIKITGDFEYSYQNNNSATSTAVDADINIIPSMTLPNGMTVQADININQDGSSDGDNSVTISKDAWAIDLGDTNSALDAIDDVTNWGYVLTNGSPSVNHAGILTLKPVDGLEIHGSFATDSDYASSTKKGYALGGRYNLGPVTVGAAQMWNDDDSKARLLNAKGKIGPIGAGYELHTDTTAAGVDTDTTTISGTFDIAKATMVGVELMKAESAGVTSSDEMTFGIHHTIADGVVAFAEYTNDDKTASEETTAIGVTVKF